MTASTGFPSLVAPTQVYLASVGSGQSFSESCLDLVCSAVVMAPAVMISPSLATPRVGTWRLLIPPSSLICFPALAIEVWSRLRVTGYQRECL